jgi:hypothetical protein
MEPAAVEPAAKSYLRVRIGARERGHTKYQQSSQQQISNSPQQVFPFHDHASFSTSSSELNYSYAGDSGADPNQSMRFVSTNLQIMIGQMQVRRSNCEQDLQTELFLCFRGEETSTTVRVCDLVIRYGDSLSTDRQSQPRFRPAPSIQQRGQKAR